VRVLVITRIFPNAAEPKAAPFNRQQMAALGRRADVEVLAVLPTFPGAGLFARWSLAGRRGRVPPHEIIDGLSVEHPRVPYVPRMPSLAAPLYAAAVLPDVLARRGKIDVVLATWAYPDGAAVIGVGRALGVPVVVKVHGSDVNQIAKMRSPRKALGWALPRADGLVSVSRPLASALVDLGARQDQITIVPNGVDGALFHPRDRAEARRELGLDQGMRWIVCVGRVTREKGALDLAEAFAHVAAADPGARLAVVGDGPALDEVRARVGAAGVFPGAVTLDRVPVWLAAADVVTLPSWMEGTPNSVLEALASGRRVIATAVGGVPDVITDDVFGELVPPHDTRALADALIRAVARPYEPAAVAAAAAIPSWDESAGVLHGALVQALGRR
jgi:glycosyltransferase involved in cell wall biosynthesis